MIDPVLDITYYPSSSLDYSKRFLDIHNTAKCLEAEITTFFFNGDRSLHICVGDSQCIIFASGFAEISAPLASKENLMRCGQILTQSAPQKYFGEFRSILRNTDTNSDEGQRIIAMLDELADSSGMKPELKTIENDVMFIARVE